MTIIELQPFREALYRATPQHELLMVISPGCPYRCRLSLAEGPKGLDRNAELKRRLQLWEAGEAHNLTGRILGQQHTGKQHTEETTMRPQTEEQRGKRACALTARGSINQQSHETTRGRSSSGHS